MVNVDSTARKSTDVSVHRRGRFSIVLLMEKE
jgi:hypothetical protein